MPSARLARPAFTLIELLVVIAIIGVLIAMLLPAIQKVREAAARTQCENNLKQLGLALHNYHDANESFPLGLQGVAGGSSSAIVLSWLANILPFLEQNALYQEVSTTPTVTQNYSPPPIVPDLQIPIPVFNCPSVPNGPVMQYVGQPWTRSSTCYGGIFGDQASDTSGIIQGSINIDDTGTVTLPSQWSTWVYRWGNPVRITDVTDGTSNTLLVGEWRPTGTINNVYDNTTWQPIWISQDPTGVCWYMAPYTFSTSPYAFYGSYHAGGGANFAFADGSVHFLTYSLAQQQLPDGSKSIIEALATYADGEVVDGSNY